MKPWLLAGLAVLIVQGLISPKDAHAHRKYTNRTLVDREGCCAPDPYKKLGKEQEIWYDLGNHLCGRNIFRDGEHEKWRIYARNIGDGITGPGVCDKIETFPQYVRVRWDNAKVPTKLVRYYTQDQSALSDPDGEEEDTSVLAADKWWSELADPMNWGPLLRHTFQSYKFGRTDRYILKQALLAFSDFVSPETNGRVRAEMYFILEDIKSGFGYFKTHYKVRLMFKDLISEHPEEATCRNLYKMNVLVEKIPIELTKSLCNAFPNERLNPGHVLGQQSVYRWCREVLEYPKSDIYLYGHPSATWAVKPNIG